jgi:hypothetical protein
MEVVKLCDGSARNIISIITIENDKTTQTIFLIDEMSYSSFLEPQIKAFKIQLFILRRLKMTNDINSKEL